MILGYGILIQISELMANSTALRTKLDTEYFKEGNAPDTDCKVFDAHRAYGSFGFLLGVIGVITIFVGYGLETFDHGPHVYYGIFMLGITIFQILLRVYFQNINKIVHRWLGRFICFWAFWCMYSGQEEAASGEDDHDHDHDHGHGHGNGDGEGNFWITYTLFAIFYGIRLFIYGFRCLNKKNNKDEEEGHEEVKTLNKEKTIDNLELTTTNSDSHTL